MGARTHTPPQGVDPSIVGSQAGTVPLERRPIRWRKRAAPYSLIAPGGIWLLLFFLAPIAYMLYVSLSRGSLGAYVFDWNIENYGTALRLYRTNLLRSLSYASVVTVITLLLAYPVSYWIAFHGGRRKYMFLLLLLLPFFVSFIIRTIQWQFILGDEGILLGPLKSIGILPDDFHVLSTPASVIAGMVYNFLPFAALPLFVALDRIDHAVVDAGHDLYADHAMTFRKVVWPLSLPGVFAAVLLTFVPAVGDYINAELLGGPGTRLLGNVIQTEFLVNLNYPLAASLSFIIMTILLVGAVVYARFLGTQAVTSAATGEVDLPRRIEREEHVARGARRRWTRFILPAYTGLFIGYLTSPIVVMILFGFNDPSGRFNVKWEGFSLDAYRTMFANTELTQSLRLSLTVGFISMALATLLGTLIGLALGRYRFGGQGGVNFIVFLAIASPEIVLGSSLLTMFVTVSVVPLGLTTILIAHVMFSISFVAVTVRARVEGLDRALDDAAADLGTDPVRTFFLVTLPLILPGVIAGAMLALALSIDDFVITNFVAGPQTTFPLWVYGSSRIGIPPQVNVMGTLLFGFGSFLVLVQWLSTRRRTLSR